MRRLAFYLSTVLLTGCGTYIQAPGAIGKLVDADTGVPIRGAQVIRPALDRSWDVLRGLPEKRVMTGRFGRFHVPVEREWWFFVSFHGTPATFAPTFTVIAEGYVTTNITVTVSSNTYWSADLGRVRLRRH
jgi:hypothetical protein